MLHVVICDDIPEERKKIRRISEREFSICDMTARFIEYDNGGTLLSDWKKKKLTIDFLFLDIYMEGFDGVETARRLRTEGCKADLIFLTTSPDFAIEGYEVEAAERYLTGIGDTVSDLKVSSWCEDYVATITIGWYADRFLQQDIPFSAIADIRSIREEVHADISCILSNALQNVLEGCMGCEDPFVSLSARSKGSQLLLRIENRCSDTLSARQNFSTTKTEEGHGFSITSMSYIFNDDFI